MEDNNAINEQPNSVVNYEEEYNKLAVEYKKLEDVANRLYGRVKQLENTWMLQRADFLFRVIDQKVFEDSIKQKASDELIAFLFPKQEEQTNDKED